MKFLFTIALAMVLAGCASNQQPVTYTRPPVTDVHGMTLHDAREAALALYPEMDCNVVLKVLGKPDSTSYQTHGQSLGRPWQAYEWIYSWPVNQFMPTTLTITFHLGAEPPDNAETNAPAASWRINDWHWYPN